MRPLRPTNREQSKPFTGMIGAWPRSPPNSTDSPTPLPTTGMMRTAVVFWLTMPIAASSAMMPAMAAADVLLEAMLKERPKDLNALLLRAAAQAGTKSYYAAQGTLERAMRAHPRSYLPYYNLANLLLQQGEDLETAREYYELGRTVGGPVNKALEARLKGVGK